MVCLALVESTSQRLLGDPLMLRRARPRAEYVARNTEQASMYARSGFRRHHCQAILVSNALKGSVVMGRVLGAEDLRSAIEAG